MKTSQVVNEIKEQLSKELPVDSISDESSIERCRDLLQRLDECNINLKLLTKTLIGTVVSKFKPHADLGPTAKALIKKWKQVAKDAANGDDGGKKKKDKRRSSGASDSAANDTAVAAAAAAEDGKIEESEDFLSLPSNRQSIAKKFHQFLSIWKQGMISSGINENALNELLISRTLEVENAIHMKYVNDRSGYASKSRSLCFNLKKNGELSESVILGQLPVDDLIQMSSEQLASGEARKAREDAAKKLVDSKRLDWDQANEDKINEMCGIKGDLLKASLFTCGRCKSVKTTSTQKQTRSADEPMTVFVLCLNCGNRWKC